MSMNYVVRLGSRRRRRTPALDLYHQSFRTSKDDGTVVTHVGDGSPRCIDCGWGSLLWAEAGYVAWHRICSHCGSHWDLHPMVIYVDQGGKLLWQTEAGLVPIDKSAQLADGPVVGLLVDKISPAMREQALREGGSMATINACWYRRARFY